MHSCMEVHTRTHAPTHLYSALTMSVKIKPVNVLGFRQKDHNTSYLNLRENDSISYPVYMILLLLLRLCASDHFQELRCKSKNSTSLQ